MKKNRNYNPDALEWDGDVFFFNLHILQYSDIIALQNAALFLCLHFTDMCHYLCESEDFLIRGVCNDNKEKRR